MTITTRATTATGVTNKNATLTNAELDANFVDIAARLATISGTNTGDNATNSQYSADYRAGNFVAGTHYQAPLVSNANIKTVGGVSLLGPGDIPFSNIPVWVKKTASYTLAYGDHIQADTTAGTFTLTLPASPVASMAAIHVQDYLGTFGSSKLVIGANGAKIMGLSQNMDISSSWVTVELNYIDATIGWRVSIK